MTNALHWLNLRRLGFVAVFLSLLTLLQLSDPDYFWHLRAGQYLFEQRALPVGDIFSYTHADQPWILHEWLFEILLYCIHAMLGPFGVKLITSLLATATLVIAYATATRKGLKVRAQLDINPYPKGIKVSDDEFASIRLARDNFHGEWSYTITLNIT